MIFSTQNNSGKSPDFYIIGAQKAATSWLWENLRKHPGLWCHPSRELHYFNRGWPDSYLFNLFGDELKRQARQQQPDWVILQWYSRFVLETAKDDAWYRRLFSEAGERLAGDNTPDYYVMSCELVRHAQKISPHAKIILALRDPIDRGWASCRMNLRYSKGIEPADATEDEIREELLSPYTVTRSCYTTPIANWSSHFPEESVLVLFYEDVGRDPERYLQTVCEFLGVSFERDYFADTAGVPVNVGPKVPLPQHLAAEFARLVLSDLLELQRLYPNQVKSWVERCRGLLEAA